MSKIDSLLEELVAESYFPVKKTGNKIKLVNQTKSALYKLMLEVIHKPKDTDGLSDGLLIEAYGRNKHRQENIKALNELFGVESDE